MCVSVSIDLLSFVFLVGVVFRFSGALIRWGGFYCVGL